jgi:alpha-ketoglutarate-dependent taurine dioxygenase
MELLPIYPEWGTTVRVTYEEAMYQSSDWWQQLVLSRNLILIKSLNKKLNDDEFYDLGQKFGRVWGQNDYSRPEVSNGFDRTLADRTTDKPVSHFKSTNNFFGDRHMDYHADMAHIGPTSYPGRLLYMYNNTTDGSGVTSWLNLELGWDLFNEEERVSYNDCWVWMHDMYRPNTRLERLPFLKTNPKTLKQSPTVNCMFRTPKTFAWIHHIEQRGIQLDGEQTSEFINKVYDLIERKSNTLYDHHWEEGDIIVYDNWFNVHKRTAVVDSSTAGESGRVLKRLTFNFV